MAAVCATLYAGHQAPTKKEIRLCEEHVRVERHPVARPATKADLAAIIEGTIKVTAEERTETVRGTVRRTEVNGAGLMPSGKRCAHSQGCRGCTPSGSHSPAGAKGSAAPD
jgi:hypothetical protein